MLGRGVANAHPDGNWDTAFAALAPQLSSVDLALANLESPTFLSQDGGDLNFDRMGKTYNLCAPSRAVKALAWFDLLTIANNHTLDCGPQSLVDTREALQVGGLVPVGPDMTPVFRDIRGMRLAFLAFDDVTVPLDVDTAARAVTRAAEGGAWVVVSIHWGIEYQPAPNDRQKAIASTLADAGATLIWGHHPHVLQPLAWVRSQKQQAGTGKPTSTLIAYSLGNALFDQVTPPDARRSAMLVIQLTQSGIEMVQAIPFEIDPFRGCVITAHPESIIQIQERLDRNNIIIRPPD
jgi:poly-gamma-glutamate synthesis protein (capsule biosynthesis protein)